MRTIKIISVNPNVGGTPGSIVVAGDFTAIFNGKFYRDPTTGATLPAYTVNPGSNYDLIDATQFDVSDNAKYSGRYTVYTPTGSGDLPPSSLGGGNTTIYVNEVVPPLVSGDAPSVTSDGNVDNISTYLLQAGDTTIIVPPGVDLTTYPLEFQGRNSIGWGEVFAQNFLNLASNFSSPTPPANPFVGQIYYDTDDSQVRVWNGTSWGLLNQASFGTTARFTQSTPATTWTVNHGLNLQSPYIAFVQFFVDRGAGPKLIIPSDVSFVSANQLTVTFSNPEQGYVLVRP